MSESRPAVLPLLARTKALLVCMVPGFAWAGEATVQQVARNGSIEAVTWVQWAFIVGFALMGWTVSELDKVAELWNLDGRTKLELMRERLKLLKSVAASELAGVMTYFLGGAAPGFFLRVIGVDQAQAGGQQIAAEFPDMVLFVFVAGAGYMGARWFAWLEARFFRSGQ